MSSRGLPHGSDSARSAGKSLGIVALILGVMSIWSFMGKLSAFPTYGAARMALAVVAGALALVTARARSRLALRAGLLLCWATCLLPRHPGAPFGAIGAFVFVIFGVLVVRPLWNALRAPATSAEHT